MDVRWLLSSWLLAGLLLARVGWAGTAPDAVERVDGPSRMDALLGNGRLTVGMSTDGVVTVLRWPSPSHFDQLHHVTALASATDPHPRTLPRMGASVTDGLFLGVVLQRGTTTRLITVDDPSLGSRWAGYASDTSPVARWGAEDWEVALVQQAFVPPDRDVLVMRLEVTVKEPMDRVSAFAFAHPAPTVRKIARWPGADVWFDDPDSGEPNGFAAVVDADARAVVALAPWTNLREQASRAWWATRMERDADPADGRWLLGALQPFTAVVMALGCDRPVQLHVGSSDQGQGVVMPLDALADLRDGTLTANPALLGDATVGLLTALPTAGTSEVTFYVALAHAPGDALSVLADARSMPTDALQEDAERQTSLLGEVALPDTDDATVRQVALRALMDLEILTDLGTGAVVASASSQPAFAMDRPTDAALVDAAWAAGGRLARALRHRQLWAGWQRKQDDALGARGSFSGGHYSDGQVASLVGAPLDGLGLSLWSMGEVVQRSLTTVELPDPTLPLRDLADGARSALDALLQCVDLARELPCPADEWGRPGRVQSVWNAAAVLGGLRNAVMLMGAMGDGSRAELAAERATLIQRGLERLLLESGTQTPLHGMALALGMGDVFQDDKDQRNALMDLALDGARDLLEGHGEGVRIFPLVLWQLLVAARNDPARLRRARGLLDEYLVGGLSRFGHAGLAVVPVEATPEGTVVLEERVGAPSAASEAALFLALLERYGRRPPPSLPLPDLGGCGCPGIHSPSTGGGLGGVLFPGVLVVLAGQVRRGVGRRARGSRGSPRLPSRQG